MQMFLLASVGFEAVSRNAVSQPPKEQGKVLILMALLDSYLRRHLLVIIFLADQRFLTAEHTRLSDAFPPPPPKWH